MGDWDWGYSLDQELYHAGGETREEAIRRGTAASVMRESQDLWVCELRPVSLSEVMPDADDIYDIVSNSAIDSYGCEEWPDFSSEAREELNSFLEAWADKHGKELGQYTTDGFEPERILVR